MFIAWHQNYVQLLNNTDFDWGFLPSHLVEMIDRNQRDTTYVQNVRYTEYFVLEIRWRLHITCAQPSFYFEAKCAMGSGCCFDPRKWDTTKTHLGSSPSVMKHLLWHWWIPPSLSTTKPNWVQTVRMVRMYCSYMQCSKGNTFLKFRSAHH